MQSVIQDADKAAQEAFRAMLNAKCRTGQWDPHLERQWRTAEQLLDDVQAAETMPEAWLDAMFDATQHDLDDLTAAELAALPDIPLAWTPGEYVAGWGK